MDNNSVPPASATGKLSSAFSLFKPSMDAVAINLGSIIGLILLPIIPFVVLFFLFIAAHGSNGANVILLGLTVLLVVALYAYIVLTSISLLLLTLAGARGQHMTMNEALKSSTPFFWRFLGLSIILWVLEVIGLILFIIPFFFVLKRYLLTSYYMVDRNLGIRESMRVSSEDSKKYSGALWGILGVYFLIGLPSVVPFIGSLVTLVLGIMYYAAPAIRYLQIKGEKPVFKMPGSAAAPTPPSAASPQPPQAPTPPTAMPPQPPTAAAPPRPLVQ